MEVQLAKLLQQLRQLMLTVEVRAVPGDVLLPKLLLKLIKTCPV